MGLLGLEREHTAEEEVRENAAARGEKEEPLSKSSLKGLAEAFAPQQVWKHGPRNMKRFSSRERDIQGAVSAHMQSDAETNNPKQANNRGRISEGRAPSQEEPVGSLAGVPEQALWP